VNGTKKELEVQQSLEELSGTRNALWRTFVRIVWTVWIFCGQHAG